MKVDPTSSRLSTVMSPPSARARRCEIGRPRPVPSRVRVGSVELDEDLVEVLAGDPDSGVGDGDPKPPVDRLGAHGDRPVVGVLDRVAEQVQQDLLDLVAVGDDAGQAAGRRRTSSSHARAVDERLERVGDLVQHAGDVGLGDVETDLARLARERSRISSISASRCSALTRIFERLSTCFGGRPSALRETSRVKPMIAFSGVRSSWLMLARNRLFDRRRLHRRVARHLHAPQQLGQLRLAALLRADVDVDARDGDDLVRAVEHREPDVGDDVLLARAGSTLASWRLGSPVIRTSRSIRALQLGPHVDVRQRADLDERLPPDLVEPESPELLVLPVDEDEAPAEVAQVDAAPACCRSARAVAPPRSAGARRRARAASRRSTAGRAAPRRPGTAARRRTRDADDVAAGHDRDGETGAETELDPLVQPARAHAFERTTTGVAPRPDPARRPSASPAGGWPAGRRSTRTPACASRARRRAAPARREALASVAARNSRTLLVADAPDPVGHELAGIVAADEERVADRPAGELAHLVERERERLLDRRRLVRRGGGAPQQLQRVGRGAASRRARGCTRRRSGRPRCAARRGPAARCRRCADARPCPTSRSEISVLASCSAMLSPASSPSRSIRKGNAPVDEREDEDSPARTPTRRPRRRRRAGCRPARGCWRRPGTRRRLRAGRRRACPRSPRRDGPARRRPRRRSACARARASTSSHDDGADAADHGGLPRGS